MWRREAGKLAEALEKSILSGEDIERAFDFFPILPHEKLSEPTTRVREKIMALATKRPTERVLLIDQKGSVRFRTLELLTDQKSRILEESTVVLPPGLGKLVRGMFKEEIDFGLLDGGANDLADGEINGQEREHWIGPDRENSADFVERRLKLSDAERSESDDEPEYLVYRKQKPAKTPERRRNPYYLQRHLDDVESKAAEFAKQLVPELESTYRQAGKLHDWGKCRRIWQTAMAAIPTIQLRRRCGEFNPKHWPGTAMNLGR